MMRFLFILTLSLFTIHLYGCAQGIGAHYLDFYSKNAGEIDHNYHLPHDADLSYWGTDKNTFFYKTTDCEEQIKAPYWTCGDFNQDGIRDYAYLLFETNGDQVFLYAFLSGKQGAYLPIRVVDATKIMGISTVEKGSAAKKVDVIRLFEFEGEFEVAYRWNGERFIEE